MLRVILFTSVVLFSSCATKSSDLLRSHAEESIPGKENLRVKRLHVYLFPHVNALGDLVSGALIKIEDPR
ncbi:MAG: hypothetical protein HYW48_02475 [Deltaproteobacteria bacterium]|nr:hypothetical protein [Deltaproteobacteria bacterium]